MLKPQQGGEIWSHKWNFRNPVEVAPNLSTTIYLTVPHDCKVGVCAHELGHLAFQWQDFYDPNYDEDGSQWDGSGVWDLMAGGSYNGDSARPAHPAPLHKLQHGWISASSPTSSGNVKIKPYTATGGEVVKLVSPQFKPKKQYLLLESRKRVGFDFDLPGEGLLVWKVDEDREMFAPAAPGLSLVQADGRNDLNNPADWNQGDAGDPFPGPNGEDSLSDAGATSTSFPGKRSGITLKNIRFDSDGIVSLNVQFQVLGAKRPGGGKKVRTGKKAASKKAAGSRKGPVRSKKTPSEKPVDSARRITRDMGTSRASAKPGAGAKKSAKAAARTRKRPKK